MKGFFIVFEGPDGSGKSTQLRFLAEHLESLGLSVLRTREPGGSPVSERIREIILDRDSEMTAETEALLYAAARAEHVRQVIIPVLERGDIVLCDRFIMSSLAYQGFGRQLGIKTVEKMNEIAVSGCEPDLTIFIKVTPERAFSRMNELKVHDRLEQEDMAFHERVFNGYIELSKGEGILSIDARGTKYETHEIIKQKVLPILKGAGKI